MAQDHEVNQARSGGSVEGGSVGADSSIATDYPRARPQLDPFDPEKRERGATLMFALAILALLVLFSTVFARLMSIERRASAYYRDRVRSKLAARAGIERAIVELRAVAGQNHYSDPYKGGWKYHSLDLAARPPGLPTGENVDLLTTRYPSFRQVHGDPDIRLWGDTLVYSGSLGTFDDGSLLVYKLKVLDGGSQLNLNHPDQRSANRMLKNLLFATLQGSGTPITIAQATSIANRVIPLVDGTAGPIEEILDRFRSKPQLGSAIVEAAVAEGLARDAVEESWLVHIRDKVTVYSWQDPDVIRPYRLNATASPASPMRRSLGLMPRSPVNLNTASLPVLYALFAELQAETRYGTFEVPTTVAQALAAAIVARRNDPAPGVSSTGYNPFKSWPEFETWLDDPAQNGIFSTASTALGAPLPWPGNINWAPADGLIEELQSTSRIGVRDLIKAQLNPNTMLNKYGALPTHGGLRRRYARIVDKSDLTRMTTEGCFDSLGVFEITSTGLIIGKDLRAAGATERGTLISAGHTDLAVVRVYTPFRLTTQSQFEKHRANMIKGNFIESPEKKEPAQYDTNDAFTASINKPAFFDTTVPTTDPTHRSPGWPGMVSWPQYSLKRRDTRPDSLPTNQQTLQYPMYETANPATFDGHLTLSNMITVRTGDNDFVAGFARGSLEAFKVRAWWEPKDVEPSGNYRTSAPTRPTNNTELRYLASSLTRGDQAPRLEDASGLESVVAEDFTGTPPANNLEAVSMFTEGSALVNTGIMTGPDRGNRFLAYDSNNLDLTQGTSIRFWVQPLLDPYSRDEEILFYFAGSNGSKPGNQQGDPDYSGWSVPTRTGPGAESTPRHGVEREAGFMVYKKFDSVSQKVTIRLRDLGPELGSAQIYHWLSASSPELVIDVTPTAMLTTGETPKPDPAEPEWIPGSWHWIVINFGPGALTSIDERRTAFVSLQVDKKKIGASEPINNRFLFRGANLAQGSGTQSNLGELHAYHNQHPSSTISNFVSAVHPGNSTSTNTFWRIYPRMLGDFYQCTQYDTLSSGAGTAVGGEVHGPGTVSYRRTRLDGAPPSAPALVYSTTGPGVGSGADDPNFMWYDFVNSPPAPGWYFEGPSWPDAPFPGLCTNRKMEVEFHIPPGASGTGAVPPLMPIDFVNDGWKPRYPAGKVAPPSPFGWESDTAEDYGGWAGYPGAPSGVSGAAANRWPFPGPGVSSNKEWHQAVKITWDEVHYMGRSPWGAAPWAGPGAGTSYNGSWLPSDLGLLDMIDHPASNPTAPSAGYEPRGGRLPYSPASSAKHTKNTAMTTKPGAPTETRLLWVDNGQTFTSYVRSRAGMTFGTIGAIPKDALDDDCAGCEDCDLDGPVIFGSRPAAGQPNYAAGGLLGTPEVGTMAVAVFDNIVFINQDPDRRTDFPSISSSGELYSGDTVLLDAKDFEDRFFEDNMAQFLEKRATTEGEDPLAAKGTGAVFHRGLMELRNRRFRLASMTWTSYPTRVTNLDFELALWKIDNVVDMSSGTPEAVYRFSNQNLIDAERDAPHLGLYKDLPPSSTNNGFGQDPSIGGIFGHPDFGRRKLSFLTNFFQPDEALTTEDLKYMKKSPYVDGLGNPAAGIPPEVLILGVRLQGYKREAHLIDDGATTIPANPAPNEGVLVSPVLETPIFEDVTLNLTFPRPQFLYVEEGAIE